MNRLSAAPIVLALLAASACAARPERPGLEPARDVPVLAVEEGGDAREGAEPAPVAPTRRGRCDADADTARFTLAHLNDLQARYSDLVAGRSRYAYVAGYLRELKAQVPETLVLDAGDDYEKGSLAELRTMGEATRQMIQALPIDVRTIGNHDFAYGHATVLRDVARSQHPVLGTNLATALPADDPFAKFARVDVGCVRVGVVGLVTQNYGSDDEQIPDAFDGVFRQDARYARVLADAVRAHRGEVDVLIALDHLGYFQDVELARSVAGIDVYVGGHSEDAVTRPQPIQRPDGGRAYVLQAGHYAEVVGRGDFVWDRRTRSLTLERHELVRVDAALPYSVEVAELARKVERDAVEDLHRPVGFARAEILRGRPMTDLVWRAVQERWGADALVVGLDQAWTGLPAGPVTLQRLYDAVPVQRQPAGTSGFSSLEIVEVDAAELGRLASALRAGPRFVGYFPERLQSTRTYRLAIEKRAVEHPELAFMGGERAPRRGRYAGELIDVLEAYARARTAKKLALD
jgi:2',3'-cyclic-nucleotide 2'-phosphodiesterase (5'-nucleotidase family)